MLSNGCHIVRKVYGVGQNYRSFDVMQAHLEEKTVIINEAIKKLGDVVLDVITEKCSPTYHQI